MLPIEKQIETLADHYLLAGSFLPRMGVVDGKTGLALFFFHYYRHTGHPVYQEFAHQLIDEIYDHLDSRTPVNLGFGLLGFGWALAYLHRQGFVEGCLDEILEEIDKEAACETETDDYSLLSGREGTLFYLLCRNYTSGRKIFAEERIFRLTEQFLGTPLKGWLTSGPDFRFEASFNLLLDYWKQETLEGLSWKTIFNEIKK